MPSVQFSATSLDDLATATWSEIRLYQGALDWLRGQDVSPGAARLGRELARDPAREMTVRDFVCRFYARQVAHDLRSRGGLISPFPEHGARFTDY